jgi:hypothetical protein
VLDNQHNTNVDNHWFVCYRHRAMAYNSSFSRFLTPCISCGRKTNRTYARAHEGKCKECATGEPRKPRAYMLCPTCGERELTWYQKTHHYHCDACTRAADPEGWLREVRGLNDYQPDY